MEYLPLFISMFAAQIVIMITPGPNVLLIAQISASQSRRNGLMVALGVATAGFIWPLLALLGLSVIFDKMVWLYVAFKWLGAGYMVYLGVKSWVSAEKAPTVTTSFPIHQSRWSHYCLGLLTSLTNPKVLIFMGSFFAAMLPATAPLWVKLAVVIMFTFNSTWWHTFVAYALSLDAMQRGYLAIKKQLDRAVGVLFIGLGIRLAFSSRPA